MKKFIKGAFVLEKEVINLEEYEKPIEKKLDLILKWCTGRDVEIAFGTTETNKYICEFRIIAHTKSMCNGVLKELKALLKPTFQGMYLSYEISGNIW